MYPANGSPPRKITEEERHYARISMRALHEFVESIGADIATIVLACDQQGWICEVKGGFDKDKMQRYFHILPAIQNPWPDAPVLSSAISGPLQIVELFDKLTNQQKKVMRFLQGRENKLASIRDAMANAKKKATSARERKSFLASIRRLNDRLATHYPNFQIDLDRIGKTITLVEQPPKATS